MAALLLAVVVVAGCREGGTDALPTLQRLANLGADAWAMPVQGTTPFDSSSLYTLINGAADPYIAHGLVKGFEQQLQAKDGRRVTLYVMSFSDPTACTRLLPTLKETLIETTPVPGIEPAAGFAAAMGPACVVYVCRSNYLVQAQLIGYESCDQALESAVRAVMVYTDGMNMEP